ncbi:acyl carrier protein [Streptomyces sp. NPDC050732]|uniref:acyl carrier protein n=1 Tax=Streptomyces sp. NPDC050732 TaxID=3154632 RepID=UPI00342DA0BE
MEATDRVRDLLRKNFGVRLEDVSPDTPFHQLRIDSLALEELRWLVEDECSVDLADVSLNSRDTVATLLNVVRQKTAAE